MAGLDGITGFRLQPDAQAAASVSSRITSS
jgi:hypothetical protein